ncbi:hypothetical protein [Streptomyces nigrescens]|uniref:hypothetical protein n=1 Tax=Streptomyces nigrescens TaxID=1920 RepID=UPI003481B20E
MNPMLVARTQGVFNASSGAWALLRLHSFERYFGPQRMKEEQDWLVRTVSGLLVSCGWSQIRTCPLPECLAQARRIGLGTALTLLAIDLVYLPTGKVRRSHALDAVIEAGWLVAWWRCRPLRDTSSTGAGPPEGRMRYQERKPLGRRDR